MTQKQQLIAMLDSSHTAYGLTDHYSGGAISGCSVLVEAEPQFPEDGEWYCTDFKFDNDGKLIEVFTHVGVSG